MSTENPTSQITEQIKPWISTEDVQQLHSNSELSQKVTKINNILAILDLSDKQEDKFRKTLERQDSKTLLDLAKKSKKEIIVFLIQNRNKDDVKVTEKAEVKNQKIDKKLTKIKSIFTATILSKNPKIADKFNSLELTAEPLEKEKILKDILELLKEPWKLKSIINDLGGADKNSSEYIEFKNNLLELDSSFESYFVELENGFSLNAN